jgi:hypothetical protein
MADKVFRPGQAELVTAAAAAVAVAAQEVLVAVAVVVTCTAAAAAAAATPVAPGVPTPLTVGEVVPTTEEATR